LRCKILAPQKLNSRVQPLNLSGECQLKILSGPVQISPAICAHLNSARSARCCRAAFTEQSAENLN